MFLVSRVIFFTALKQLYKETTFTKAINSLFLALESINRALLLLQLLALILLQQSHFNKQNQSNLSKRLNQIGIYNGSPLSGLRSIKNQSLKITQCAVQVILQEKKRT